jgi:LytS/YehU family sensor histidine kinase
VQSLLDHDVPKARAMLESFTDYLRSSLGSLRQDDSTLDHELNLAQAYLTLLKIRMEDRLQFSIEHDESVLRACVPPLLLQPLVENAIQHGLEPSIQGGHVRISARLQGRQVVLEVQDDGLGPDVPSRRSGRPGTGLALVNLRQRLSARFGGQATLEIQALHPGTLARITLPLTSPST